MVRISRIFALSLMTILGTSNIDAHADVCEARVIDDGTLIKGKKIYSNWIIGHDPWRWANVSFRYRVVYVDENNNERSIDGFFSELIMGRDDKYTKLKNTRYRPARVTLTKYSDLICDRF